jgi:hypothetical protein
MLMIGLYTCDLLAVVMTILRSIDTIAGEISLGMIHAVATKPLARWENVAITFAGTIAVRYALTGALPEHPVRGFLLVAFECLLVLAVTFYLGTRFTTLTAGVAALGPQAVAFMGAGWSR